MNDLRDVRLLATDLDNTMGTQTVLAEGMRGVQIHPGVFDLVTMGRDLLGRTGRRAGFDTVVVTGRGGRDFFPREGEQPRVPQQLVDSASGLSMEMGGLVWTRERGLLAARFEP